MSRDLIEAVNTIPVLIDCPPDWDVPVELGGRGRAPDGYLIGPDEDARGTVRVLRQGFLTLMQGKRWEKFCKGYGVNIGADEIANLRVLVLLSQFAQTGGYDIRPTKNQVSTVPDFAPSHDLKMYVELQAEINARERLEIKSAAPDDWSNAELQAKEIWKRLTPSKGHALLELAEQLNKRTRSARLVLWYSRRDGDFRQGLYFSKIQDAIYGLFALQLTRPERVGICQRCGKVFTCSRAAQKFCSVKCGNYFRKKRERNKPTE